MFNMSYIDAYRKTLKPVEVFADYITYRPLAFPLVLLFKRLRITPNMVTFGALICFLLTGYFLARDITIPASILIFLGTLFDCVDGQLARMTNQSSKIGALLDYYCDILGTLFIFTGIIIFQLSTTGNYWVFLYAALSLLFSGMHISLFDDLRKRFIAQYIEKKPFRPDSGGFTALQARIYSFLAPLPRHSQGKEKEPAGESARFSTLLKIWSFIAGTMRRNLLIVLCIIDRVDLLWICCILYFNLVLILLSAAQWTTVRFYNRARTGV